MEYYENFVKNIQTLRKDEGISAKQLSRILGFSPDRINDIELGKGVIRLHEALLIAFFFKESIENLSTKEITTKVKRYYSE